MDTTLIAAGINEVFYRFDYTILNILHELAVATKNSLTPFFTFISMTGDYGVGLILIGLTMILFRKTRKAGIAVLLGMALGAILTNIILKPLISRPRPYEDISSIYHTWWEYVGGRYYYGDAFPSGHTTAAMAMMSAIFLSFNKKYSFIGFLFVILMGVSRNYLMVHYPSDIFGGILIGGFAGYAGVFSAKWIYIKAKGTRFEKKLS